MNKRITLVSLLDDIDLLKIEKAIKNTNIKTCKLPYAIDDNNRDLLDTLPYHFTIFATNPQNQDKLLSVFQTIKTKQLTLKVNDVKIMNGKENSYVLYYSIEENQDIKDLQRAFSVIMPQERYNPDDFVFHLTINIDKDLDKIKRLQQKLKQDFKPFELKFNKLGLFEIYPAKLLKTINLD